MKILVVTAHPDDLENGSGGTFVQLVRAGHQVISVVATLPLDPVARVQRAEESGASHRLLGCNDLRLWGEPDGSLEATAAIRDRAMAIVNEVRPDAIFTLWPADAHQDHRTIASVALGLALPKGVNTEIICFEVCSSGRSAQTIRPQTLGFYPTHYNPLTPDILDAKRAMMRCHQSQDPEGMWLGVGDTLRRRGAEAGVEHAEAFVRLTRVGDLHPDLRPFITPTTFVLPRGVGPDFLPASIDLQN